MDYARRQRDPGRHVLGIAFVVLIHALVIYALVTGLARKAVEVIKKPITATIIEEIKAPPPPPPPPPPKRVVEQPKIEVPIQPYVPPPDIPPPPQPIEVPTITAVTPEPPPKQEYVIAPPPPPVVVEAPPAPPKPTVRRGITRISGSDPVYPREAIRAGVQKGRVTVRLQIDERGNVTEVIIVSSDPPRVFDRAVRSALQDWKFRADGERYTGEVEVNFTLKDE
jgi:protein TonB